ncbi:HAD family hydrolase [Enemella sp. A6]|uniref:HAD family hydrolase n=1 Tax=Enemella sp. A6 TaxID=3440152 RepID=UPI003EB8E048
MPEPITAVLFDFHSTLVDQGEPAPWLAGAWQRAGKDGTPAEGLGEEHHRQIVAFLDELWTHGRRIDPEHTRDLGVDQHRKVFGELAAVGNLPDDLVTPLWETMLDHWVPYDDTRPVLTALRSAGIKVGLLSNIGLDLAPTLHRQGLDTLLDAATQSWQVGAVKPEPAIFTAALEQLGADPRQTLMVGDSWSEDGAAAGLGMRTLILPRTRGPVHGLDAVLRLVGVS